jgi:hypothetical protein
MLRWASLKMSLVKMLSIVYAECCLCWVYFMMCVVYAYCCLWSACLSLLSVRLSVVYSESCLCWVSFLQGCSCTWCHLCWRVIYAKCHSCKVFIMLGVIYAECHYAEYILCTVPFLQNVVSRMPNAVILNVMTPKRHILAFYDPNCKSQSQFLFCLVNFWFCKKSKIGLAKV